MNWEHYRRLVNYLERLPYERFDYSKYVVAPDEVADPCGCVAVCVASLTGDLITRLPSPYTYQHFERRHIRSFLEISHDEAKYLYGDAVDGFGDNFRTAYAFGGGRGASGIREALRRLAIVAQRHGGEPQAPQPTSYQPDDQHFLASVRSLIDAPLVEVE